MSDITDAFDEAKPDYPTLRWQHSLSHESSKKLRDAVKLARKHGHPTVAWLSQMQEQITAVEIWETRTAEIRKTYGLDAAERAHDRAYRRTKFFVERVVKTLARTVEDAACKVDVLTGFLVAGYGFHNLGEDLATSILNDVRILGAASKSERRRA